MAATFLGGLVGFQVGQIGEFSGGVTGGPVALQRWHWVLWTAFLGGAIVSDSLCWPRRLSFKGFAGPPWFLTPHSGWVLHRVCPGGVPGAHSALLAVPVGPGALRDPPFAALSGLACPQPVGAVA